MKWVTRVIVIGLISAWGTTAVGEEPASNLVMCTGFKVDEVITRVAFGSCGQQDQPQPIWHTIADAKPDLFIFLGDNIYGDTEDMNVLRAKYAKLGAMPGFQRLCREGCRVMATWDDHDYGINDGGAEYPKKKESKEIFLDFFNEPSDSPRRTHEGIYDASIIGPEGRRVQVILLDTRTFRSPLKKRVSPEIPGAGDPGPFDRCDDPNASLLGEEQWKWLEAELRKPAELRIIATSIQFVADGHHWEKWGNFPAERARLIRLLEQTGARGVMFISGDRHSAEIGRWDDAEPSGMKPPYPLIDVTASPINQFRRFASEINPHRVGSVFFGSNFGVIEIDWSTASPTITAQIRDIDGATIIRHDLVLSELSPR